MLSSILLLSLLRIDFDPLLPFLTNTTSRRRAVRYICSAHSSDSWGELWLTRLWNFWGHALRSGNTLPVQVLLRSCNSHAVGRPRVPKSFVLDFAPRKLQKFWLRVREDSPDRFIEALAQDRVAWKAALPLWLNHWGFKLASPIDPPDLSDRQLLLVGKQHAVLRPARLFPDAPYCRPVQHVLLGKPSKTAWFVWALLGEDSVSAIVVPPLSSSRQQILCQGFCGSDLLEQRLMLWDLLLKLYSALPELQDLGCNCFLPVAAFGPHIWAHRVPLPKLSDVQRVERTEISLDFLNFCLLQPEKPPPWIQTTMLTVSGPFPSPFRFLIRSSDFSQVRFLRHLQDFRPFS